MKQEAEYFTNENPEDPQFHGRTLVKRVGGKITEVIEYNDQGEVEYFIDIEKMDELKKRIQKLQKEAKSKDADMNLKEVAEESLDENMPENTRNRILELMKIQGFMDNEKMPKNIAQEKAQEDYEAIQKKGKLLCTNYIPLGKDLYYYEEIWAENPESDDDKYIRFLKDDNAILAGTTKVFRAENEKAYRTFELFNVFNDEEGRYENLKATIRIKTPQAPEIISFEKIDPANNNVLDFVNEEKLAEANLINEEYKVGFHSIRVQNILKAAKDLTLKNVKFKINEN